MDDPLARGAYQVFLYVLLYVGTAALGGFIGYIVSFLYHEQQKDKVEKSSDEPGDRNRKQHVTGKPPKGYKSPR